MYKLLFISIISIFALTSFMSFAADHDRQTTIVPIDSIAAYHTISNNDCDIACETDCDDIQDHPAEDIYSKIWTSARLNPYKTPIDSLPDSIQINMAEYTPPTKEFVRVTSHFGTRRYRFHHGTDLKLNVGDTVYSSFSGKVRIIDYERRGYGHYVVVRHDNGLETVYAHLSRVLVSHDQIVSSGTPLALGGNTGRSTGPHLHYEVRYLGNAINPIKLFNFELGVPYTEDYLLTKNESFSHHKELKALAAAQYYKVRSGDCLSVIARRYGTSVGALCRLNGIRSNSIIRIGQTLRVR